MDFKSLEAELLKLTAREKAIITYKLLESLESDDPDDIREIWVNEALDRYNDIRLGKEHFIDSELMVKEALSKYK